MPAEVKILVEGTTNADSVAETGEEKTRPTISLIRDGNLVVVVDPGVLESQQILINALEKEGLKPDDVTTVCITHSHIDHYRNIGMFPKAKTLEYFGLWSKESVEDWPEHFSTNIHVLKTPGHDYTGITLLVATNEGTVAICGDVFWKEDYPKNPKDDAYALNPEDLEKSREEILKIADWIVPGHAGMYKVKRGLVEEIKNGIAAIRNKKLKTPAVCKKCKRSIENHHDICICRPWLCYRCCECGIECDLCNCAVKNKQI